MYISYIIIVVMTVIIRFFMLRERSFLKKTIRKLFLESIILIRSHEFLVLLIKILIRNILECLIDSLLL